jgi:hypothetical protein
VGGEPVSRSYPVFLGLAAVQRS